MSEARMKYDTILEQMQLATAKVMSNCTKIAERVVPDNINLWAKAPDEEISVELKKEDIKSHYTTYVEFTPISPEEEARRHSDGMNLVKTGVLSSDTMRRRYLSHIDPETEDIKVEAEKLRNDPAIRQVLAQIVAQVLMGEATRLGKIKALQAGNLPTLQGQPGASPMAGQPGAALSGQGMAQALSQQMRQVMGTQHQPPRPGSPEELAQQMATAGKPSTGGRLAVPGTPITGAPYGLNVPGG
jgi:hypothetical protein